MSLARALVKDLSWEIERSLCVVTGTKRRFKRPFSLLLTRDPGACQTTDCHCRDKCRQALEGRGPTRRPVSAGADSVWGSEAFRGFWDRSSPTAPPGVSRRAEHPSQVTGQSSTRSRNRHDLSVACIWPGQFLEKHRPTDPATL